MQWFIKEQVEEVSTMSDLLTVVERAKDNPLLVEEYLAREGLGEEEDGDPTAPTAAGADDLSECVSGLCRSARTPSESATVAIPGGSSTATALAATAFGGSRSRGGEEERVDTTPAQRASFLPLGTDRQGSG